MRIEEQKVDVHYPQLMADIPGVSLVRTFSNA